MIKTHYIESDYESTFSEAKMKIWLKAGLASACGKLVESGIRRRDLRMITCPRCKAIVKGRLRNE